VRRRFERQRVVAHTRDDQSIEGVLVGEHRDCIQLSNPVYLDATQELEDKQRAPLSGDVVILHSNLAYFQVLGV
jgi:hypothetical protein